MRARLLPVVAVGLLVAADAPQQSDQDRLRGTVSWKVVSVQSEGQEVEPPKDRSIYDIAKGDTFVFEKDGQVLVRREGKRGLRGGYRLHADRKPKQIDLSLYPDRGDGVTPRRVPTFPSIYELEGDTLKIALAPHLAKRPTEFATKKGSEHYLIILKRQGPC